MNYKFHERKYLALIKSSQQFAIEISIQNIHYNKLSVIVWHSPYPGLGHNLEQHGTIVRVRVSFRFRFKVCHKFYWLSRDPSAAQNRTRAPKPG